MDSPDRGGGHMAAPVVVFTRYGGGKEMGSAADYRQNAAECLRLARSARSVEHRNILAEMAQTWVALAEQAEQLEQQEAKKNRTAREGRTENKSRRIG